MQMFGDGFDLYAAPTDASAGYWDTSNVGFALVSPGRFVGSRALSLTNASSTNAALVKSSGSNDAVHHIVFAMQQTAALSGTSIYSWFTLGDGATAQCTVCLRGDGAMLLTSGNAAGATLATYSGAIGAINTWYAFEVEVVINNTTGSFTVRKNGNTSNDFTLGSLNTRGGTTNNYASRFSIGASVGAGHQVDDVLWRSDAASVPWVGDVRCFTRMPASDASVAWSRSGSVVPYTPYTAANTLSWNSATSYFTPFTAPCSGAIGSLTFNETVASTANFKCSIYASAGGVPTTVLGSATVVSAPPIGTTMFTFGTPVSVTQNTQYWIGWHPDTTSGTGSAFPTGTVGFTTTAITYAAFPVANPTSLVAAAVVTPVVNITATTNSAFVADFQQDGANSYVYSSTVGQSDLYGIASIGSTPSSIVGVTTRGYCQKSDAGTRNVAVQLQSGATNVQSASTALNTTFAWVSRVDLVDPATGSAWTATGVNNATIGAIVTA